MLTKPKHWSNHISSINVKFLLVFFHRISSCTPKSNPVLHWLYFNPVQFSPQILYNRQKIELILRLKFISQILTDKKLHLRFGLSSSLPAESRISRTEYDTFSFVVCVQSPVAQTRSEILGQRKISISPLLTGVKIFSRLSYVKAVTIICISKRGEYQNYSSYSSIRALYSLWI